MLFLPLDSNGNCKTVFCNDQFEQYNPEKHTITFEYHPWFQGNLMILKLFLTNEESFSQYCPEELKEIWEESRKKLKIFLSGLMEAKVDLENNCFYDFLPKWFLLDHFHIKMKILEKIFDHSAFLQKDNYNLLFEINKLCSEIEQRPLNLNFSNIRGSEHIPVQTFFRKREEISSVVRYDIFSKTGRLSLKNNSFPISNLNSLARSVITPINDYLVEFDFNAIDIRTFLYLAGEEQPKEDIHDYHVKLFDGKYYRDEIKRIFFAWLYGAEHVEEHKILEKHYSKNDIYGYKKECKLMSINPLKNPYGRELVCDEFHKMNYIIQSTSADTFYSSVIKLDKLLKEKGSSGFVSFMMHDSVILDLAEEDLDSLKEMKKLFSDTLYGKVKTSVKIGKNYGEMEKL